MLTVLPLLALVSLPRFDDPGLPGEPPLAILTAKALVCPADADSEQYVDHALVLVRDGEIEWVGPRDEGVIPDDAVVLDVGERWVMPGMIDLHSHIGGTSDWGAHVYLTNPGARVSSAVVPDNELLRRGVAGGVTTILFIPGSATNMGGQGVLLKTGFERYEDMLVRDPGSLKLAQAGNPERWAIGVSRAFMNWNTRATLARGLAYASAWELHGRGVGPEPQRNIQWDVFRELFAKRTQVSTHTQLYQVVLATVTMLGDEFELDAYIDHGSFDGYRAAGVAMDANIAAILGPRQIAYSLRAYMPGLAPYILEFDTDGQVLGTAAKYQEGGHREIGFNTDAIDPRLLPPGSEGGMPGTEELSLHAAMAVRYGLGNDTLEAVRGLTIVPAKAAGLDHRVGSLEPGKDADLLIITGDPADPRTAVEVVLIEGERIYDVEVDERRW